MGQVYPGSAQPTPISGVFMVVSWSGWGPVRVLDFMFLDLSRVQGKFSFWLCMPPLFSKFLYKTTVAQW